MLELNNARYELTAVKPEQYPASIIPEVAFVGRSNVGKSSFINALLNRRNLARVGATPGKTREINFYNIDNELYFVDLPGYGYAAVSKAKKSSWNEIVDTYLNNRSQLKLITMLVDIRHVPSKDDKIMYEWILNYGIDHMVIATKADKIPRSQVNAKLKEIRSTLSISADAPLVPFSSETKHGKDEIWDLLNNFIM